MHARTYTHTLSNSEFISMGWDAPAGQAYSTVADLAKLMMLVFRDDQPINTAGQVWSFFRETILLVVIAKVRV